jgi:hypothetical protein
VNHQKRGRPHDDPVSGHGDQRAAGGGQAVDIYLDPGGQGFEKIINAEALENIAAGGVEVKDMAAVNILWYQ